MRKLFGGIGAFLQTPVGVIVTTSVFWQIMVWVVKIPHMALYFVIASALLLGRGYFCRFYLRDRVGPFLFPICASNSKPQIQAGYFCARKEF